MSNGFSRWLEAKYGSPAAMSAAWRRPVSSFDDVPPAPSTPIHRKEDLPPHLDWQEYQEHAASRAVGPGILEFLWGTPAALPSGRGPPAVYERIRLAARELSLRGGRPTVAEVCQRAAPGGDAASLDFAVRAALMHGADPDALPTGATTPALAPLLEALVAEQWSADHKVLILCPRVYIHMKRLCDEGLLDADEALGFERPIQMEGPALVRKFIDLTDRACFPFAVSDTRLPLDVLRTFPLVLCPTLEILSSAAMQAFESYVLGGGFLALGPRAPLLDETMQRDDTLARHFGEGLSDFAQEVRWRGEGAFLTLPGYVSAATIEFLAFESGMAKGLVADGPGAHSAVLRAGRARMLWVANANDYAVATVPTGEQFRELRNVETGETLPSSGANILAAPETITAWRVT